MEVVDFDAETLTRGIQLRNIEVGTFKLKYVPSDRTVEPSTAKLQAVTLKFRVSSSSSNSNTRFEKPTHSIVQHGV